MAILFDTANLMPKDDEAEDYCVTYREYTIIIGKKYLARVIGIDAVSIK